MNLLRVIAIAAVTIPALTACSASFEDVRAQMDAIRQKPRGTVEPPPEFTPLSTFTYAAHQLRSPFAPPISAEQLLMNSGKKVEPDLSRPSEYLERFSLEALRFRGAMQRPGGPLFALIEDGDGGVQRVKVGSYCG